MLFIRKSIICIYLFIVVYASGLAQSHDFCGQHIVNTSWFENQKLSFEAFQTKLHLLRKNIRKPELITPRMDSIVTIPVVFQILHENGTENISEAQIKDQIRILNRDYSKQNADISAVVPAFKNNIADVGFRFELANTDPQGNCTNGIVRHQTPKTNWDANRLEDFTYSWPTDKYLNFYVVRSINVAPAYTFLPGIGIPPSADVIVTQHNLVGSIGTANVANSRALTHEVGHWFGLPHIWGITNAPGVMCGDDFVDDTPITKGFITCSVNNTKICSADIEENVQNYMDYSPCKIMFTNGQAAYMRETIQLGLNQRDHLVSLENLMATGIHGDLPCKTKADFFALSYSICEGDSLQFFNLSQTGSDSIQFRWIAEGGMPSESFKKDIVILFPSAGNYDVKLIVNGIYGSDTLIRQVHVSKAIPQNSPYVSYDFDDGELHADLSIINKDNDGVEWQVHPDIGADNTVGCLFLHNSTSNATPFYEDYVETPSYDFTNSPSPRMSFYYSYAKKFDNQNDAFRIEYTLDCGKTWQTVFGVPPTSLLANQTGGVSAASYVPESPEQWKKLNLTTGFTAQVKNKANVRFRFYFRSDGSVMGSNNFYLDEINIFDPAVTAVEDEYDSIINIFPNPSSAAMILEMSQSFQDLVTVTLLSPDGAHCKELRSKKGSDGKLSLIINEDGELPAGIYFLKINNGSRKHVVKKIVIVN